MLVIYPDVRNLSGCSFPIRMRIGPGATPSSTSTMASPTHSACNSLATTSNFEVTLLELQRFQRLLKLHPNELRAKFWETVPQPTQQVARRHERPWPRARPGRRDPGPDQATVAPGQMAPARPRPRARNVRCRRSPRRARDPRSAPRTRRRDRSRRSAHAPPARASRTGSRCASPRC